MLQQRALHFCNTDIRQQLLPGAERQIMTAFFKLNIIISLIFPTWIINSVVDPAPNPNPNPNPTSRSIYRNNFFTTSSIKLQSLRVILHLCQGGISNHSESCAILSHSELISLSNLKEVTHRLNYSSCQLNIIPTRFLKEAVRPLFRSWVILENYFKFYSFSQKS